jgi:hypothetical protein
LIPTNAENDLPFPGGIRTKISLTECVPNPRSNDRDPIFNGNPTTDLFIISVP